MNEADALDVIQSALWMVIVGGGPAIALGHRPKPCSIRP